MIGRMSWISQESPNENCHTKKTHKKNGMMSPLTVKKRNFENVQKPSISNGTRFSQPKYHIPR